MKRFDADLMVKEVHEITETLIKIKAGRMTTQQFSDLNFEDDNHIHFNNHNFAEEDYGNEYDGEYGMEDYGDEFGQEYGLENCKYVTKSLKKNKKPSVKQTSNIISHQIKKKI